MLRRDVLAFLPLALAGCAVTTLAPPKPSSIAVVSLLGDRLSLRQVGITVFGNSERSVDVSDWSVDEHVQASTGNILRSAGYEVKRSTPQTASSLGKVSRFNLTSTYSFAGGASAARKAAADAGVDYLFVVAEAPNAFTDPFFRTNQFITGYGIYQRRGGGGVAFAFVSILLVEGKTGEVVYASTGPFSLPRDDSLWIEPEGALPTARKLGQPRETFLEVIDGAVRKGLSYFKIVAPA